MCNCTGICDCNALISTSKGEKGDPGRTLAGTELIASAASEALTVDDNGIVIYLSNATGKEYTLPSAPTNGTFYEFSVYTSVTSNAYNILASGTDTFSGSLLSSKAADHSSLFSPVSTDNKISLNGTTTGGLIGTNFRVVYLSVQRKWFVSGDNYGSGALATPFSTI